MSQNREAGLIYVDLVSPAPWAGQLLECLVTKLKPDEDRKACLQTTSVSFQIDNLASVRLLW